VDGRHKAGHDDESEIRTALGMIGATEAIRAENVVKTFGKITALAGVSLSVKWGETLGILGDNGAGKSTLIKILTGYHEPDSGQIFVDGTAVQLTSVDGARALGIECVYQDLALVNGLSIYHNMFLNRELLRRGPLRLLDHREMRRRAAEALAEIGVDVPSVELAVGALSGGQRQAIAVARAVYSKARILLLDEPLAAMGAREARLIIELIERLRARGDIAIVMIAHNYAQTLEICDRVVLMQHGEVTFESEAGATSAEQLLEIVRREYRAVRTG
jgi:simple sugar transport system ATP-binding protein